MPQHTTTGLTAPQFFHLRKYFFVGIKINNRNKEKFILKEVKIILCLTLFQLLAWQRIRKNR